MISIRPSRADDVEALYAIWEAAVKATHDFLSPEDFTYFSDLVRTQYLPAASFWCAVDGEDDKPLGFLGMTETKVDALFVAPERHGQGLGRLLLDHARTQAAPLTLDVNEQNAGAVAFYRRMGFREIGRSQTDDAGRPYPLLHMVLKEAA